MRKSLYITIARYAVELHTVSTMLVYVTLPQPPPPPPLLHRQ